MLNKSMLIYELLSENREQKKPKGFHKPSSKTPADAETKKPSVKVVFSVNTFWPSYQSNVHKTAYEKAINNQLAQFIAVKKQNPFASYAGKDRPMDPSNPFPQNEVKHASLSHDHRLFYSTFRKDHNHNYPGLEDNTVYLLMYGIYTHDNCGTGTRQNRNLQTTLAHTFAQDRKNVSNYRDFTGRV